MGLFAFEVFVILILIIVNGIFSMSELAVVSARPLRLQRSAESGSRGAQVALDLAQNPRQFLSTVQIGITLVGVLTGAFGGATMSRLLAEQLSSITVFAPYADTISFAIVVIVITYFSIILGELIPKSLALSAPERIATFVSQPMRLISRLSAPAVWALSAPTAAVLRLFDLHAKVEPPVTDEEIKDLISAGTKAGVFEETEQNIIERVIELEAQRVTSVMTPRTKIVWIDLQEPPEMIRQKLIGSRFSRLPVARGRLDDISGYVTAKAILQRLLQDDVFEPEAELRLPLYVPESVTVLELLEQFRESHTHLAVIVDEFGGVEGLVTMHDLLQVIVGELANTPHQPIERAIETLEDGSIILDGRLSVFEFRQALEIGELPGEEREAYQTVAGFALARLGKVPQTGDSFKWGKYEFTVRAMDRHRVSKVSARALLPPTD